jgi:glycosyltransferase involved in cell wall biosynthesis
MRILLASNASYVPPRGGSTRSNLVWLRHLASHGHECRVIAAAESDTAAEDVTIDGIRFLSLRERPAALRAQIAECQPDWVLISSEDLGHSLLREAFRSAAGRVVYLAHTPQFFPFGPESWHADPEAARLIPNAAAVVAISRTVGDYIARYAGCEAVVVHPPMYGKGPWRNLANLKGAVTMVNPCAVKGISVFLALADRFPHVEFHALRGWGTTAHDETELARRPNIKIIATVSDIEEELARTRVLLMPSLWYEGFGLIVTEAMLRGIPVIASNRGGLMESKLGTSVAIPVNPITDWEPRFDDRNMPVAVIPKQDIDSWAEALASLLTDNELYAKESSAARKSATAFVESLDAGDLLRLLQSLQPSGQQAVKKSDALTPLQRAVLLKKLRQRV